MKRPYSLLFFVLFSGIFAEQAAAQSYPFEEKWEYIEKQELDGQLKSLKPEVEELYQQSKKEQQVVHRIRALLYLLKIDLITEERPQREQELYRRFTKEIETAAGVERSILQSHLAQALDEYYRHYMGALRQRTPIHADTVTTDDLAVWSQAEYGRVIEGLYQASLENDGLKEEPTDRWELLLDTAVRNRELRPTMFDILAHRASDYYRASSYYGGHDRGAADKLLADLAAFHLEEGRISAYLYNQVLLSQQYWKGKGLDEGIAFLRSLSAAFPDNWYTSQVLYELGQLYQRKLNEFDQDAFSLRKQYADSILALSETVTRKFPESPADFSLQHMRAQIVRPNITLHTDMYVLPEQPFHAVIKHKNLHSVYVKVLPAKRSYPHGQRIMLPSHRTQQVVDSFLLANPAVQEYELALKHFGDYEERRTISVMNALPAGEYLIVLSDNKAFLADRGVVVLHQIAVSGHALVFRGDHMLLTDRQTGKPLPRQRISVYTADRKPGLQSVEKQGLQLLQQLTTDE